MIKKYLFTAFITLFTTYSIAKTDITIFAAASLANVIDDIAVQYKTVNEDVNIIPSFASSSTLARQIEHGAPADIFISADQQWMNYLADKQLIEPTTRTTLLGNRLVLISANSKLKGVSVPLTKESTNDWDMLLAGGKLAVGDPDHVPAGIYAKEALTYLGLYDKLSPDMARANNVRAALMLVERGETNIGIVYRSDVTASNNVFILGEFPEETHTPITYPATILKDHNNEEIKKFFDYLRSDTAKSLFEKYGFFVITSS